MFQKLGIQEPHREILDANMAAEPWIPSRGPLETIPEGPGKRQKTISEQMDEDLEMINNSVASAAGATSVVNERPPAIRRTMREVTLDPRLLTKPGECPSERGTTWRLWRTKMEGWIYGVSVQIGQAMEEAATFPGVIASVPTHLRQASSFLYAELLAETSGVQMEIILEVTDRNGFEAWRRLAREMERDIVNRKLAIIEALSRPDFGCDMVQWRQRWKRWEREVKHYLPQVGSALTDAMRIAIVRQRAPEDLQKHLKLNAMTYGEQYEAFHDD